MQVGGVPFLVDTGACRSLLPRPLSRTRPSLSKSADIHLVGTSKSVIPTHGYETLTLLFGSAKYNWKFLVADITLPIFGADILSHFKLLIGDVHHQLVNSDSYTSIPLHLAPSDFAFYISALTNAYTYFLTSYLEVFCPEPHQMHILPSKHGIYHHIKTTRLPILARLRSL
ncbi:uncharacterized protein [Palaemon carinicauda]|uniref:uncharacterized protein n=1 Tax=Palaemon carinicauda TaxID=392227 RepID=UPI0035B5AD46